MLAGLGSLEGAAGDGEGFGGGQSDGDRGELAGPETVLGVGEGGLEFQGAGRGIDGVVHEDELAFLGLFVGAGGDDFHLDGTGCAVAHEGAEVLLGDTEGDVDGAELVDGYELAAGFVDADKVALVDGDVAGAACKGGADGAVIELQAGVGGGGFASELLGLEGAGRVRDGLKLFLGDKGAVTKGAVAVDLGEGGAELDLDALKVGFGRAQAVLEGAGVDTT